MPETSTGNPKWRIGVLDLFTLSGATKSNNEARRLLEQGGLYINNNRVMDSTMVVTDADLASESYIVLRVGKKKYTLVRIKPAQPRPI